MFKFAIMLGLFCSSTLFARSSIEASSQLITKFFVANRLLWASAQDLWPEDALRRAADTFEFMCQKSRFSAELQDAVDELRKVARSESTKHRELSALASGTDQALNRYLTRYNYRSNGPAHLTALAKTLATLKQDFDWVRTEVQKSPSDSDLHNIFPDLITAVKEFEDAIKAEESIPLGSFPSTLFHLAANRDKV